MFQGPISLAFTDLKPKDVLDSATERSKKERGREGLSSTFASKGRGLNRSMLRMKAAESYRISAINTRGYYSLLAFLMRVIFKGGSYLKFSK